MSFSNKHYGPIFDIAILGGGINGTGIAADASLRGLSVVLFEQDDLASGTSSASTKLIHGGLRYLEYYEFRLVQEALAEREVLLEIAPHLVKPMQFIMPHDKHHRSAWLIRCGLYLYDYLAKRKIIPHSGLVKFATNSFGKPLKSCFTKGFSYYDCWADDARLVIANAMAARERQGRIFTRYKVLSAKRLDKMWHISVKNLRDNQEHLFYARSLVNASGPWLNETIHMLPYSTAQEPKVQLVKGSHIVVPKLYEGNHAYLLQNADKRVIFLIPYLHNFTLIGTTDINLGNQYDKPSITPEEIEYLCTNVNTYLAKPISAQDIKWHYSGLRPLQADDRENPSAITRDYSLTVEDQAGTAPLLTVLGGKITTFRKLSEHAVDRLSGYLQNAKPSLTASTLLPGGMIPHGDMEQFIQTQSILYPWLPLSLVQRYAHQYGSNMKMLLSGCESLSDLGQAFSSDLYQCEIDYLREKEWAMTSEDILWRRTKLGLTFEASQLTALENYLAQQKIAINI